MIKRSIFAAILVFLAIISIVSASFVITEKSGNFPQNKTAEAYQFNEPDDLDWEVRSHSRISFWCPENADSFKIRQKINSTGAFLSQLVSDDDIQEFLNECNEASFFYFKGRPLNSEIGSCFDNMAKDFPQVDFSTNPKIRNEIIRECYIRERFNQTFNGASGIKSSLLDIRAGEFIDNINYEIAHSNEKLVIEEKPASDPLFVADDAGRDIVNISCKREFGDECNKQILHPNVGAEPASNS